LATNPDQINVRQKLFFLFVGFCSSCEVCHAEKRRNQEQDRLPEDFGATLTSRDRHRFSAIFRTDYLLMLCRDSRTVICAAIGRLAVLLEGLSKMFGSSCLLSA